MAVLLVFSLLPMPSASASPNWHEATVFVTGFKTGTWKLSSNQKNTLGIAALQNKHAIRASCTSFHPKTSTRAQRAAVERRADEVCKELAARVQLTQVTSERSGTSDRKLHDKVRLTLETPFGAETFKTDKLGTAISPDETLVPWGQEVPVHPDMQLVMTNPEILRVSAVSYNFRFVATSTTHLFPRGMYKVNLGRLFVVFEDGTREDVSGCKPNCDFSMVLATRADLAMDPYLQSRLIAASPIEHPKRLSHILLEPTPALKARGFGKVRWDIPEPKSIFKTQEVYDFVGANRVTSCYLEVDTENVTLTLGKYPSSLERQAISATHTPWKPGSPSTSINLGSVTPGSTTVLMGSTRKLQGGFVSVRVGNSLFCEFYIYDDVVLW